MSAEKFYLVKAAVLPETYQKVMQVKEQLQSGRSKSVNGACKEIGLSRSAYYKYRDAILPFYDNNNANVLSLLFLTEDYPGVLSGLMECLAALDVNILTINQNYPINGLADISLVVDIRAYQGDLRELMTALGQVRGVREHRLLART